MSQNDILRILDFNRGKWFTSKDFRSSLNINLISASRGISKVIKYRNLYDVEFMVGRHNKIFIRKK